MSLASFLTSFVVAKVRKRGASYLSAGQVTLAEWSAERVVATVSGSEDYSVEIRREGQDLRASCTCPFFDDRDELCKHIWATLLAADREGALRGPRGGMPRGLYAEPAESSLPKRREPPRARAAPPPPAWHAVLDRLQVTGPPLPSLPTPARTEEILYVIDVPATVQKQRLTLNLLACRRKLDGSRGATHPLRITRGDIAKFPDPADREALALLAGATKGDPWNTWYYSQYEEIGEWKAVPDESAPLVARLLCATGRCHLRTGPQALAAAPLAWDDGPPWEVWLAVREEADGGCTVGAELRRGGERRDLEAGALLLRSGLLIAAGRVTRFERDLFGWTPLLRGEGGTGALRVPAAEREDLLTRLLAAPTLPHLELPEALRVEEVRATPRPRVRLHSPGGRADAREQPRAELSFLYDGGEVAAAAPRRGFYQREERRFLLRDPAAEARSGERLLALGFRPTAAPDGRPGLRVPQGRIPAAVRTLLAEGWSVEAEGKLYRSAGAFRLAVASGIDWLELHGEAEFEGATVALPALLAALRRGEGFVALGDGSLGVLPEEWLQRLAPLAGLGQPEGDHLQFRSSQAALLDAWLAGEPAATCDEAFAQARERLRGFAGIAAAAPPPGFQGELRPYQRAGLGWLGFLQDFRFGGSSQ